MNDQYALHKKAFDMVVKKYGLDREDKAGAISEYLTDTSSSSQVSAPAFAEKFGMSVEDTVVFLEWIKVGIKFKEEAIDTAKKAGMSKR